MSSIKSESTSAAASRPRRQIYTRPPVSSSTASTMPEATPSNESTNLAIISSSCQFFWMALDPTDFPDLSLLYIIHNGVNYSSVRVIERDILTMYLSLSPEAQNNQLPTEPCTQEICDLLNDLNFNHYEAKWGPEKFEPEREKLVKLEDFQRFYNILKTTCQRKDAIVLTNPRVNQHAIRPQQPLPPQQVYYPPPPRYALLQHPFSNLPVRQPHMYGMDQYGMSGQIRPPFHHHHHHHAITPHTTQNSNNQVTAPCANPINNSDPHIASQMNLIPQPPQTQNPVQVEAQLRGRVVPNPLSQNEVPTVAKTPTSSQAKSGGGITAAVRSTIANFLGLSPSRSQTNIASVPTATPSVQAQEKQTEVQKTTSTTESSATVQSGRNETPLMQSSTESGAPSSPCISLISIRTTSDSQSSSNDTVVNIETSTTQSTSTTALNSSKTNNGNSAASISSTSNGLNKPDDALKTPEKNASATESMSSETQTSKSALSKSSLHKQVISMLQHTTPPPKMVSKEAQVGGKLARLSKSPLNPGSTNMEVDENSAVSNEAPKETRSVGTSNCSIQQIDLSHQITNSSRKTGLTNQDLQQNGDTTMATQPTDSLSDWNMKVAFRFPKYVTLPSSLDRPNRLEEKELRCLYRSFAKMLFTDTVVSNDSEMWRRQFLMAPKRQPGNKSLVRSLSVDLKIKRDKRPLGPINLPSKDSKKMSVKSKANKDFMAIFNRVTGSKETKTEKNRLNSSAAMASEATTSKKEKAKLNSTSTASDFASSRKEKGRLGSLASDSSTSIKSKKGGRASMSAASSVTDHHPADYIKCQQYFAPAICKRLVLCPLDEYIDMFNYRVTSDTFDDENSKDTGANDTDSSMDRINTSVSRRRARVIDDDDESNDKTYVAPSDTQTPGQPKRKMGRPKQKSEAMTTKPRSAERTPR